MINLKKLIVFALLILLVVFSGCKGKKDVKKSIEEIRTGTDGIVITFLPLNPPDTVHIDQNTNKFDIVLELQNKGVYPPGDSPTGPNGKTFIGGHDAKIVNIKPKDTNDLATKALQGKSLINLNGGSDLITFTAEVNLANLNVEKYPVTLLATACYEYETIAGPTVCIDPNPYSTIQEKKICQVQDIALSSQGAPVAVTKVEEEAFAEKTQFKITIKNVGLGDVIKYEAAEGGEKCNPLVGDKKLTRDDVDKVLLSEVKIADYQLQCKPFAESTGPIQGTSGSVRLINGEGSIVCDFTKQAYQNYRDSKTSFTTPLTIHLKYFYRSTGQRNLLIQKEGK